MNNLKYADAEEVQQELEYTLAKNNLVSRIRKEFTDADVENQLVELEINPEFGLNLLVQMVLHKRANLPTLIGLLRFHFDTLQECANAILDAAEKDIIDYEQLPDLFVMKYDISDDVKSELQRFQYPLPMVVAPKEIQNNNEYGYLTLRGSIILRNNHHDEDVNLDHINIVNSIKLSLNTETVNLVQNKWDNIDKPKQGESFSDYKKRLAAFKKYDESSRQIIELMFMMNNKFYLTHSYDKRGRTYARGYHINYQGNDWNKAVIEFNNEEVTC